MTEENQTSTLKPVMRLILEWSGDKPLWIRDALRRVVLNGAVSGSDVQELHQICKRLHGADDNVETEPLSEEHLPHSSPQTKSISLTNLGNVEGVNQLAPNQRLTFEPFGLTVIYGPNGTGKTGYTRILKKICRARMSGEIIPNVYKSKTDEISKGSLCYLRGDEEKKFDWENGAPVEPELSSVTVFDRECGAEHIRKANEVWFRPFGLDIPDELASAVLQVKELLLSELSTLNSSRDPVFDDPFWSPTTEAGRFMERLDAETDASELEKLPNFDEAAEVRLRDLDRDLQTDPHVVSKQILRRAQDIETFIGRFEYLVKACSPQALKRAVDASIKARASEQAALFAAEKAFSTSEISGVGGEVWGVLWQAARNYSKALPSQDFPPKQGQNCVLCHQSVDPKTEARMAGFEEFVQADTNRTAYTDGLAAEDELDRLRAIKIPGSLLRIISQEFGSDEPELARAIRKRLAIARLHRNKVLMAAHAANLENFEADLTESVSFTEALGLKVASLKSYAAQLVSEDQISGRQVLVSERDALRDRKNLKRLVTIASREIGRLKQVALLEKCAGDANTAAITRLGNRIADELVTPLMRGKFHSEIAALAGGRVAVEFERTGGKAGTPRFGVKLYADASAKVHSILSEGEQTCVALAAYLTELATADHKSGLIFDDPVTSLDHRWRRAVAKRLANEAKNRQVVVFTHDLVFVNDLASMAEVSSIKTSFSHLGRGEIGIGVVSEKLPWQASSIRDRIDKLEKLVSGARKSYEAQDDTSYRAAVSDFYNKLRSTWERCLEDVLFGGVILRHRDYINTKGLSRVGALCEADIAGVVQGFSKCSDFTDAHDESRGRDSDPPAPQELTDDLEALRSWEDDLRKRQNAHAKASH